MLAAKQKRKENIAEYILYMYQIEDMIRAMQFDIEKIEKQLVSAYKTDGKTKSEIAAWYKNLLLMMEKEGIRKKGHLQFLVNVMADVYDFHLKLMETGADARYVSTFQMTAGLLGELHTKNPVAENDIQLSIDTIYGFLLLKMKNVSVTPETEEAVTRLSQWLGQLSKLYRNFETGDLSFE